MKLKDAFNAALDAIRYIDSITIARDWSLDQHFIFEHVLTDINERDPHRVRISYYEYLGDEKWRRLTKTSKLSPAENRVNVTTEFLLDSESKGWRPYCKEIDNLVLAKQEIEKVISIFKEEDE